MRAFLIISLMLSSCSWSTHERVAFSIAVAAQGADAATTMRGLDEGYTETNFILGKYPSDGAIILHKVTALGVATIIGHFYPKVRLPLFYYFSILGVGAATYNMRQIND